MIIGACHISPEMTGWETGLRKSVCECRISDRGQIWTEYIHTVGCMLYVDEGNENGTEGLELGVEYWML